MENAVNIQTIFLMNVLLLTVKMQNYLDFSNLKKEFIVHYMGTEVPLKNTFE